MTIQLTLPADVERRVCEIAARRGLSAEAWAVRALEEGLSREQRLDEFRRRLGNAADIAEFFAVSNEMEDEDLDDYDLMAALNANRLAAGERPLYPTTAEK